MVATLDGQWRDGGQFSQSVKLVSSSFSFEFTLALLKSLSSEHLSNRTGSINIETTTAAEAEVKKEKKYKRRKKT